MTTAIKVAHFVVGYPYPQIKSVDNDLKPLQDLVGGMLELVRLPGSLVLLCNEEAIMMRLPIGFAVMAERGIQTIRGNFFICRESGENFASILERDALYCATGVVPVPN